MKAAKAAKAARAELNSSLYPGLKSPGFFLPKLIQYMLEKDFNTIVTKSLNNQAGFGFKIPDERSTITGFHSKNPFDVFGVFDKHMVCWESKYLPKPQSFNFNHLQDHQIDNLIKIYELMGLDRCLSVFAVGVDFGRNDKRVFIWKNEQLYQIKERKANQQNILKKEFEGLTNYVKIKKGEIDMADFLIIQ